MEHPIAPNVAGCHAIAIISLLQHRTAPQEGGRVRSGEDLGSKLEYYLLSCIVFMNTTLRPKEVHRPAANEPEMV